MSNEIRFKAFSTEKRDYAPSSKWEEYRDLIEAKLAEGLSQKAIIQLLKDEEGVDIKLHQFKRLTGDWGLSKRNLMAKQRHYIWQISQRRQAQGKSNTVFRFKRNKQVVSTKHVNGVLRGNGTEFLNFQHNDGSPGLTHDATPIAAEIEESANDGPVPECHDQLYESEEERTESIVDEAAYTKPTDKDIVSLADVPLKIATHGSDESRPRPSNKPEMHHGENSGGCEHVEPNRQAHVSGTTEKMDSHSKVAENIDQMDQRADVGEQIDDAAEEVERTFETTEQTESDLDGSLEALHVVCQEILDSVNKTHSEKASSGVPQPKPRQEYRYSNEFTAELEEQLLSEKRVASLFLQNMNEEIALSGGTIRECFSQVRLRWLRNKPGVLEEYKSGFDDWDPLPYRIYQQLDQIDLDKPVRIAGPREVAFWKDIRIYYSQRLPDLASFCLEYPVSHEFGRNFRYQAAHFLTLAQRFGESHFVSVQALTTFVSLYTTGMGKQSPIRILYKILRVLDFLGLGTHSMSTRLLDCIDRVITEEVRLGDEKNLRYLVPVAQLHRRISNSRIEQDRGSSSINLILDRYASMLRLGVAYAYSGDKEKGVSIVKHIKAQMLKTRSPVGISEWMLYGNAWYWVANASGKVGSLLDAQSAIHSAVEVFQRLSRMNPTDRTLYDSTFDPLSWLGTLNAKLGDYKSAIENEKRFMDFRKEKFGAQDKWYVESIENATNYMEQRGLVRYSQPILALTIETYQAIRGDKEVDDLRKLWSRYCGPAFMQDATEFGGYGLQTWNAAPAGVMELGS